jgi:hypothetical protein
VENPAAGSAAVKHSHCTGAAEPLYRLRSSASRGDSGTSCAVTAAPAESKTA